MVAVVWEPGVCAGAGDKESVSRVCMCWRRVMVAGEGLGCVVGRECGAGRGAVMKPEGAYGTISGARVRI
eukprot:33545-Eustigmatos_ZCMA.PRE.1